MKGGGSKDDDYLHAPVSAREEDRGVERTHEEGGKKKEEEDR